MSRNTSSMGSSSKNTDTDYLRDQEEIMCRVTKVEDELTSGIAYEVDLSYMDAATLLSCLTRKLISLREYEMEMDRKGLV